MVEVKSPEVAIVDYGLGNMFSVRHACEYAGISAVATSDKREILAADAVILPGVGAFGDAMAALHGLDLVQPLQDIAVSDKLLVGVCLGMQLLMTESCEFGMHRGLGILEGTVVPLAGQVKVPQVGWNRILMVNSRDPSADRWANSPLADQIEGVYMYFVHSFYTQPADPAVVLATTEYGDITFCSSLQHRNIFACQFHPERSGSHGLQIYRNIASSLKRQALIEENTNVQ
jgi:imidazole glycerol-phosphate synthase subunit HisH